MLTICLSQYKSYVVASILFDSASQSSPATGSLLVVSNIFNLRMSFYNVSVFILDKNSKSLNLGFKNVASCNILVISPQ